MRKIYVNLIKLALTLAGSGVGVAAYAQSPQQMDYYCQTHHSYDAQQMCAQYFQEYNDENDNGYYPIYYNYPYYVPGNVIIQNGGHEEEEEFHGEHMGHVEGGMPEGGGMGGMHMGGGGMHMGGGHR